MLPGNANFIAVPSDRLKVGVSPKNVLRYPRLGTVLMVEEAIREAKEYPTKAELLRHLDKKIMYQTFNLILDYLRYSGKTHIGEDKKIAWIWDPEGTRRALSNKHLVAR